VVITTARANSQYPLDYIAPGLEQAGLSHQASYTLEKDRLQVDVYK
jgi:hypothetical protein